MPVVRVVLGDNEVSRYSFDREAVSIGRARDCNIVVENLAVSRNHAQIERLENEVYILTDLGSANGTSVNGVQITSTEIMHGDEIRVGKHSLFFEDDQRAEVAVVGDGFEGDRTIMVEVKPEASLTVVKGKQRDLEFQIVDYETVIGRGPDCAVRITDWFVSREHAMIVRQGRNFFVRDLGSWKGILVNGKKTADTILQSDDLIKVGSTELRFECEAGGIENEDIAPPKISDFISRPIKEEALWLTGQAELPPQLDNGNGDADADAPFERPKIEIAADIQSQNRAAAITTGPAPMRGDDVVAPVRDVQRPLDEHATEFDDDAIEADDNAVDIDDNAVEADGNATEFEDDGPQIDDNATEFEDDAPEPDSNATEFEDDAPEPEVDAGDDEPDAGDDELDDVANEPDDAPVDEDINHVVGLMIGEPDQVNATPVPLPWGEEDGEAPATESEPTEPTEAEAVPETLQEDEAPATETVALVEEVADEIEEVVDEIEDVPPAESEEPGGEVASEEDMRQIKMWERALENPNPVIQREAARNLRKLTGREYDV